MLRTGSPIRLNVWGIQGAVARAGGELSPGYTADHTVPSHPLRVRWEEAIPLIQVMIIIPSRRSAWELQGVGGSAGRE